MTSLEEEFTEGEALALLRNPLFNAVLVELERVAVETIVNSNSPDDRVRLEGATRVKAYRSVREVVGRIAEPETPDQPETQIVS